MSIEALNFSVGLKCTVDTRSKPVMCIDSSVFRFQNDEWCLYYRYYDAQHVLGLQRTSISSGVPLNPFHVSVQLEGGEGRIVTGLSEEKRFTDQFMQPSYKHIWEKRDGVILPAVPEFRLYGVLKLIVVLTLADSDSRVSHTERSVPEAAGQSRITRSISVQTTLLPNRTSCFQNLSEDLAQLMVEDSHHDVEFQCADQSIKAHKLIVCKRSPVIASMLASDMVEGRTGVVKIPDIEPAVFNHFLRYIYSGQLPELTVDLALSLYESGDQYAVLGLAKRCSEYLVEHLSAESACRVLVVADAHSGEDLRESVIGFMLDNEIPLSGGDWQDFSDAHPKLANEVLSRFCLKLKQRMQVGCPSWLRATKSYADI